MLTIKGAIFGNLSINSVCLSFKSEERKQGKKYRFGSSQFNQYNAKINKKWKLESIREVVLKRYNLIRQAVEIYFQNSKSIFISFFHKKYLSDFIKLLEEYKAKRRLNIIIIHKPELYFLEMKFKEKWQHWEISNFEYLMLLNKFGGRSFNDLGQYPVFPWILRNYESASLNFQDKKTFRKMKKTIAGMSVKKRSTADEKYSIMLEDTTMKPYQFGSHYLAGRSVLGYLFRLEPYSSLLIQFEHKQDNAARMFHLLKFAWEACNNDPGDNKELIPEFFYLPEMFGNYNGTSYGTKIGGDQLPLQTYGANVRVDEVILPSWAKNNHHFIQTNAIALESKLISSNLHLWIDLIFGDKQQDKKYYNLFKECCDEEGINKKGKLSKQNIAEIQEFGSNPIKIFKDKHPAKDAEKGSLFPIFPIIGIEHNIKYGMARIRTFNSPIIYIGCSDKRLILISENQTLTKTKETCLTLIPEQSLAFEKKDVEIFPFIKANGEHSNFLLWDMARSFVFLEQINYLISCRHYDDSIRINNIETGEVMFSLNFHKVNNILYIFRLLY